MVKDKGRWWKVWPNGTLHPEEGHIFKTCPSGLSFKGFMDRTVITHPDGHVLGDDFQSPYQNPSSYFTNTVEPKCLTPISVKSASGEWGFISPEGEVLADGIVYEDTLSFKDGHGGVQYAGFKVNGLWGLMTDTGEVFRDPQYKSTSEVLDNIPGYESKASVPSRRSNLSCAAGSRLFMASGAWGLQ